MISIQTYLNAARNCWRAASNDASSEVRRTTFSGCEEACELGGIGASRAAAEAIGDRVRTDEEGSGATRVGVCPPAPRRIPWPGMTASGW